MKQHLDNSLKNVPILIERFHAALNIVVALNRVPSSTRAPYGVLTQVSSVADSGGVTAPRSNARETYQLDLLAEDLATLGQLADQTLTTLDQLEVGRTFQSCRVQSTDFDLDDTQPGGETPLHRWTVEFETIN